MNFKSQGMAVTTLTVAAVAMAGGTACADTESAAPGDTRPSRSVTTEVAPGVRYSDNLATGAAVLSTPLGTVVMQAGRFDIRDVTGRTVAGTPIEDTGVPAAAPASVAAATDSTAQVAGEAPGIGTPAGAPAQPVAGDLMSDLGQAVEAANPHMGAALAVGTTVGSVVGAVIGCPFGIATGGTLMSVVSVGTLTAPALVASCLVGAVAVGGFGAVVGGVGLAIPVGIAAGVQRFNQLQAQHAAAGAAAAPAPDAPANS
jgi:hypothetical protein